MDAFAAFQTLADDSTLARDQSDEKQNDNELHHAKSLQELIQLEIEYKHKIREKLLKLDLINDRIMMEMESRVQELVNDMEAVELPANSYKSLSLDSCNNICTSIKDRIQALKNEVQILENEAEARKSVERSCNNQGVNANNLKSVRNLTAELLELQRHAWSLREKQMLLKQPSSHAEISSIPARESTYPPNEKSGCETDPKSIQNSIIAQSKGDLAYDFTF
uniref:AlNc14C26G2593 protein n=1 Tax=Albugo laibachii Nc14 TaxID=890382 RepID=F0W6V7_9STRA|nr:AlNc14C26G2593 [Albugo laibachii Nc14]|eukprot:CCA16852.1 AlNc14C26G2593 [Albugo laibachii Nc14]